jgi:cell filamentation protein
MQQTLNVVLRNSGGIMSDKIGDDRDPYLYPGLNVMRNKLNIRQAERLAQASYELTALRAATLPLGPPAPGLPHLCAIHRHLYQDIFDWAGDIREVDIYQGDTRFCHFAYIEKEGNGLMQDLEEEGYLVGLEKREFIARLSHYYCEINVLHPFRIGNGIAQDIEPDFWSAANQSGAMGDLTDLTTIFAKVVSEARETE